MSAEPGRGVPQLLALTLEVWQIEGTVESPADAPVVACVRAKGMCIDVERAEAGEAFRWYLCVRGPGNEGAVGRRRPCGSLVGVLGGLRRLLAVEAGGKARVARGAE